MEGIPRRGESRREGKGRDVLVQSASGLGMKIQRPEGGEGGFWMRLLQGPALFEWRRDWRRSECGEDSATAEGTKRRHDSALEQVGKMGASQMQIDE